MKFFLISDNVDTKMGMRFAGIDGVVVHTDKRLHESLLRLWREKMWLLFL